tara:strand:+ start:53 stop:271 length:219 start_codon:yes stop_codon:yes gene_type:complete
VDPQKLVEAVGQSHLVGTITEEPTKVDGKETLKLKAVNVEATTEQLRNFLKQHPDMIFQERTQILKKTKAKS